MLQRKYQSQSVKQKDKYCSYTSHSVAGTVGNYTNARKIQTQPRYLSNCPTICSPCPVFNQWNMFAKCRACARAGAFCFTGTNHMAYMIHRERESCCLHIVGNIWESTMYRRMPMFIIPWMLAPIFNNGNTIPLFRCSTNSAHSQHKCRGVVLTD